MKGININLQVSSALAKRDFLKYIRNRSRLITSIFQSLIFLAIFGMSMGHASLVSAGIIAQSILFSGIFAGVSIVQDKMFGFHKEIMVAPISRTTITLGKALGGTLISSIQGLILLIITSALGIFGYDLMLFLRILSAIPIIFLIAFLTVSIGNLIATKMNDFQQMQFLMTFLIMPMFFTSGAIMDFVGTPFYYITLINPMTYAVDAMRYVMLFGTTAASFGMPLLVDILVLVSISLVCILLAAYIFRKSESV
ncbi:MAG: ABC transporter permease [Candidatus Helarchaeota archaeon]